MKILLVVIFIVIAVMSWIFATSVTVDGKNTKDAFIVKTVFYWIAVVLAFSIGYYIA